MHDRTRARQLRSWWAVSTILLASGFGSKASLLIVLSVSLFLWLLVFLGARWLISAVHRRCSSLHRHCDCTLDRLHSTLHPPPLHPRISICGTRPLLASLLPSSLARVSSSRGYPPVASPERQRDLSGWVTPPPPSSQITLRLRTLPTACRGLQSVIGITRSRSSTSALVRTLYSPDPPERHTHTLRMLHTPRMYPPSLPIAVVTPTPSLCSVVLSSCPVYVMRAPRPHGRLRLFTGALSPLGALLTYLALLILCTFEMSTLLLLILLLVARADENRVPRSCTAPCLYLYILCAYVRAGHTLWANCNASSSSAALVMIAVDRGVMQNCGSIHIHRRWRRAAASTVVRGSLVTGSTTRPS